MSPQNQPTGTMLRLKRIVKERVLFFNAGLKKDKTKYEWIFDLRLCLLNSFLLSQFTDLLAKAINQTASQKDFCLGCPTMAADPLVGSLLDRFSKKGQNVNGFIVRSDRKEYGLQKIIEGNLSPANNVFLLDDLINSGASLIRAVKAIKAEGGSVRHIFVLIDFFKDNPSAPCRKFFLQEGISIHSLWGLGDFGLDQEKTGAINSSECSVVSSAPKIDPVWRFGPLNITAYGVSKSSPVISKDGERLYLGADSGFFYCLDFKTGKEIWKYQTKHSLKGIHSTPVVWSDRVCFGDYAGRVHLLDQKTGAVIWQEKVSDYIGSSPCLDREQKYIFIGTEHDPATNKKAGGLACLNVKNGKLQWLFRDTDFIHCAPCFLDRWQLVVIGSNSGRVFGLNREDGQKKWLFLTAGKKERGDVKYWIVTNKDQTKVLFGSFNRLLYCLEASSGRLLWQHSFLGPVYFAPLIINDSVFCASGFGDFYCLSLADGRLIWQTKIKDGLQGGVASFGNLLLGGSLGGEIFAINQKTGQKAGSFWQPEKFNQIPLIKKGKLILGNRELFCFKIFDLIKESTRKKNQ